MLAYSTYFGGTSEENIHDIALDPSGNIYVTGRTQGLAGFPTTPGAFQPTKPGASLTTDAFVSKFNPAGSALIYSTFLGGSGEDNNRALRAGRVAVDTAGNAYVAGDTSSADFPVSVNAADATYGGGLSNPSDGYYVKLGPTGGFLYGTFIGGSDYDYTHGIAVDPAGNVYVMGATRSDAAEGFAQTANAFSATLSGTQDAFLTKFDAGGARVYSTFLGGTGQENSFLSVGGGVVVDGAGRAYLTGETPGLGFPIVGGYQTVFGGVNDAFLAVIDTTLSGAASLVYSTYLGGTGQDLGYDIAYAGGRQVVIVGEANPGFPVVNAFDATHNGGNSDVFVARLDTALSGAASLLYSTYVGGADYEFPWDVAIDPLGAVHVVGETRSTNFPAVNPIRTNFFQLEPFVFKMNAGGTALVYSTLFGIESNYKQVRAVATNAAGDTFIAGATNDTNNPTGPTHFPRVNAFQSTYGGGNSDGIIARIASGVDLLLDEDGRPRAGCHGRYAHLYAHGHQQRDRPGDLGDGDRSAAGRLDVRVVRRDRWRRLRRYRQHACGRVSVPRRGRVVDRDDHGHRHRRHGRDAREHGNRDLRLVRAEHGEQHRHRDLAHAGREPVRHRQRRAAERLGDALRPRSQLGHRRQRRRRRSRRRRPDEPAGAAGGHAPARLRDHLPGGGRHRHVLRHAAGAGQPDGRRRRSCSRASRRTTAP